MDGGSYLTLTFTRNRFATDVAISYEGFADCLTWLPVFPATIATTFVDFETELWTVHILAPEPRFFIRARVQN